MSIIDSEVVVIGAGPAGTTTSLFLSKAGIPHIIFEKEKFPRDKICGDALSGKVTRVLNHLDPQLIYEIKDDPRFLGSWGVRFIAPNGTPMDVPLRKDMSKEKYPPGFIVKRMIFDKFLSDKIDEKYADKRVGCDVKTVTDEGDAIRIEYMQNGQKKQCRAQMVVGAGGDRCLVARQFADRKIDPKYYAAGMRGYYKNVSGLHPQNFVELHFIPEVLPGYLWIFPLPNGEVNVGIGLLSSRVRKKNVKLKKVMLNAIANHPDLKRRFKDARLIGDIKGWGLPLGAVRRPLSGNRFILAGDAGSLIDPFTGEGIGNAMLSGQLASQTIVDALQNHDYSASMLKSYDERVYGALWQELQLSYRILQLVDYPWLFNWLANKAAKNKTVQETMMSMYGNLDVRAQLKKPSFYIKLLLNR